MGIRKASKKPSELPEPTALAHPLLHAGRVAPVECAEEWEGLVLSSNPEDCDGDPVPLDRLFC